MFDKHLYHSNTVVASSQVERSGLYWGRGGGGSSKDTHLETRCGLDFYMVQIGVPAGHMVIWRFEIEYIF